MTLTTTLEHVTDIDVSPETTYPLWTTSESLCDWWGTTAEADARPGGTMRVNFTIELDPPHGLRFRFGWLDGEPPPGGSEVVVRLDRRGTGTRPILRHSGLPVEVVGSHTEGWTHFLPRLRESAVS